MPPAILRNRCLAGKRPVSPAQPRRVVGDLALSSRSRMGFLWSGAGLGRNVRRVGDVLGSHCAAQRPRHDVAGEVVEHGGPVNPAPRRETLGSYPKNYDLRFSYLATANSRSRPYVTAQAHMAWNGSRTEVPRGVIAYSTPTGEVGKTVRVTKPYFSIRFKASDNALWVMSKRLLISLNRRGSVAMAIRISIVHLSAILSRTGRA